MYISDFKDHGSHWTVDALNRHSILDDGPSIPREFWDWCRERDITWVCNFSNAHVDDYTLTVPSLKLITEFKFTWC